MLIMLSCQAAATWALDNRCNCTLRLAESKPF
jgi:hypothetical protein